MIVTFLRRSVEYRTWFKQVPEPSWPKSYYCDPVRDISGQTEACELPVCDCLVDYKHWSPINRKLVGQFLPGVYTEKDILFSLAAAICPNINDIFH